jgi:hypothetical protein
MTELALLSAGVALATLCLASTASAQTTQVMVDGVPLSCADPSGTPVIFDSVPLLPDIAISDYVGKVPRIRVNAAQMRAAPPKVQLFFHAHECAHHMLGHVVQAIYGHDNRNRELQADCKAMELLRDQVGLAQDDAKRIGQYFRRNPPLPPYYPAGPWREKNILDCFGADQAAAIDSERSASTVEDCMARRPADCIDKCESGTKLTARECAFACNPAAPMNRRNWLAECRKNPDW